MIKIDLTFREGELLHRILQDQLSDIALEMTTNEIEGFAELLRQEEVLVKNILESLQAQGVGVSAEMYGGYSE